MYIDYNECSCIIPLTSLESRNHEGVLLLLYAVRKIAYARTLACKGYDLRCT